MFLSRAMPSTILISSCEFMFFCSLVFLPNTLSEQKRPNKKGRPKSGGPQPEDDLQCKSTSRYPAPFRVSGLKAEGPGPCICLSKCMGRLVSRRRCLQAQVHPGFSGFEKVSSAEIDVNRRLRSHLQARLGFQSPNDMLMQRGAHINVHI